MGDRIDGVHAARLLAVWRRLHVHGSDQPSGGTAPIQSATGH